MNRGPAFLLADLLACMIVMTAISVSSQAQPSFTVTPSSITFANRTVGTISLSQPINVTNTGNQSITVGSYTVEPLEFPLFLGWAPQVIAPGNSTRFKIRFAPDAAQVFSGSFTITVEGAQPVVVSLQGTGLSTGAVAVVSPTTIA